MDRIAIILISLAVGAFFACFLLLLLDIGSKRFIKKYKKEKQRKKDISQKLIHIITIMCSDYNIPITYHDDLGEAAGRIIYHRYNGEISLDNARIEIKNDWKDDFSVLAHEMGHYLELRDTKDTSEQGADQRAYELCQSLLLEDEKELLSIELKYSFPKRNNC